MWSKWQWVSRIASTSAPVCSIAARIRVRLVAGVDDQQPVAALAPDQEAVLRHLADGQHLDVEATTFLRVRGSVARSRLRQSVLSM